MTLFVRIINPITIHSSIMILEIFTVFQVTIADESREWWYRKPVDEDRTIIFQAKRDGTSPFNYDPIIGYIGDFVVLWESCDPEVEPEKYFKVAVFKYRSPNDKHGPFLHKIRYIKGRDLTNRQKLIPTSKLPKEYQNTIRREQKIPEWDKKLSAICESGITQMGSSYQGFTKEYIDTCLELLSQIPEPDEFKEEWKVYSEGYVSSSFRTIRARSRLNDYLQPDW